LPHGFLEKSEEGVWGLYSSGRIFHLHQPPGAGGDIFQERFGYDNDYGNSEPARIRKI